MNKILKISLTVFLMLKIFATSGVAEEKDFSSLSVEYQQGTLVIQANGVPLGKILDGISSKCRVKIEGLESRKNESITFSSGSGTLYEALRRLFSLLDEGNYAFEFHDQELVRVLVLPETDGVATSRPVSKEIKKSIQKNAGSATQETKQEFVTVPKILQIDADSQAEAVGLLKGDLIVEYGGVKIRASNQLVGEVKKKTSTEEVEIVVIRDQKSMRFSLEGGAIGVGVEDVKIPKDEFESYY
jgi:membrane-associated protease RseP (regulator of RpoE activity)